MRGSDNMIWCGNQVRRDVIPPNMRGSDNCRRKCLPYISVLPPCGEWTAARLRILSRAPLNPRQARIFPCFCGRLRGAIIAVIMMTPFQLDVEIRTPLAGGDIPTLDAILLGEIVRMDPGMDPGGDPQKARQTLNMLQWRDGVPQVSALLSDSGSGRGETTKTSRVQREYQAIGPLNLKTLRRNSKYPKEMKGEANLMSGIPHRIIGDACFIGVGDIAEIRRILQFWMGIGAQWRNGWGEVGEWRITPQESADKKTWGLVENGEPQRPLPREWFLSQLGGDPAYPIAHRRVAPPYWSPSSPRVPAVVPDERRHPLDQSARPAPVSVVDEGADVVEFLFNRFARYLLPKSEAGLPPADAVAKAMRRTYPHRTKRDKTLRLGKQALAVISEEKTRLFSHAVPKGPQDDSFQVVVPPESSPNAPHKALLWDGAMTPAPGPRVIVIFDDKTPALDDLLMFSGESDRVVLSGKDAGTLYRSALLRILEIAKKGEFSIKQLVYFELRENLRRRDPGGGEHIVNWMEKERQRRGLSEEDLFDLQDLLAAATPAGWAVLSAAPLFRGNEEGGE